MTSNMEIDVPKKKVKQAIAMVNRCQQGLMKKLRNIDLEYSKSLTEIDRDLEKTRASLKAFRVEQSRLRSDSFDSQVFAHKQDFRQSSAVYFPSPPRRRRSQTHTVALKNDDSFKLFERRRSSEVRDLVSICLALNKVEFPSNIHFF